ncbi:hypothetical protein ACIA8K_35675 [Catenuloplanes sp. NPDC051500]|uniref:hypothetical protein n=1 Tax=Catenuloplanes sp. NPDC051500 TaxID=3363959 RepID=UPI00379BB9E6
MRQRKAGPVSIGPAFRPPAGPAAAGAGTELGDDGIEVAVLYRHWRAAGQYPPVVQQRERSCFACEESVSDGLIRGKVTSSGVV